jgi:hypothetical protein
MLPRRNSRHPILTLHHPNPVGAKGACPSPVLVFDSTISLPFFREAKEKKEAQERYWKLHEAGKTEQAKSDLARLAVIRKQREEAAAKRKAEQEGVYLAPFKPYRIIFLRESMFLSILAAKEAEIEAKKAVSQQKR